jgi:glycosyltransferase involved in cell wall biosynthesis
VNTVPASASVIIITKNDPEVRVTVDAVLDQIAGSQLPAEVIVVDASDTLSELAPHPGGDATIIPFQARGIKATIPEQRNVGIARSRGDVIVFIDSGCIPMPDWLASLLAPITSGDESIVAGSHRGTEAGSIRDRDAKVRVRRRYLREAPTINLAVLREVFNAIGGFDENFGYGSDVDFTWRAVDAGYRVRYVPDAVVRHNWGSLRGDLRRTWIYGHARVQLYVKHPQRRRRALRDDPVLVLYPVFLMTLPLARTRPRLLLLSVIPVIKNVRSKPMLTTLHNFTFGASALIALVKILARRVTSAKSEDG